MCHFCDGHGKSVLPTESSVFNDKKSSLQVLRTAKTIQRFYNEILDLLALFFALFIGLVRIAQW